MLRRVCSVGAILLGCAGCIDIGDLVFDCVESCGGGGAGGGASGPGGGGTGGDGQVTYFDVVMADAPAGYWRLDAIVDATRTLDESGAGRHADLTKSDPGGSFEFGVSGAIANDPNRAATISAGAELFVQPPHPFVFANGAPYTIEMWIKLPATAGARVVSCEVDQGMGYSTFLLPGSIYHKRHDSMGGFDEMTIEPFAASEFQHIVIRFDPAEDTNRQGQIFQNGEAVYFPGQALPIRWEAHGNALMIASTNGPQDTVTLDEVAIYDRALALNRIQLHYQCGKTGVCE
jgi:hypothetical protein